MLRGTNRSIIEINETENKYFEKILVFVKPEFGTLPAERLAKEATRMVGGMATAPVGLKGRITARRRMALRRLRRIFGVCIVGGVILAVAIILSLLL